MNRPKRLIHIVLGLMTGLFLAASITSCTSSPKNEKFIGIQLWSVREDMKADPSTTLKGLSDIGYKFIEAAGYADGKFYGMEPVEFKELVEFNELQFLASHTGRDLPDSATWDETMAWWDQAIAAHSAAGVKYIVQPWMGKAGYASLEGLKQFCDYFNAVGEKCNASGIRFGYHNHDNEFKELEGEIIYDFMLKNTDPEKVMFQLDLYWIFKGGKDAVDYFSNYPGRFELWHVKDVKELGESGQLDFRPAFENTELAGMKYYIVEQEAYSTTPMEGVKVSFDFLNSQEYTK
jgi:sugar phosphate isomerase/epimerase